MKIYVAGMITGNPDYREQFEEAAAKLRAEGHIVMNPAILPDGFEYEDYMHICFAMIDTCEAMALLPNWRKSPGVHRERKYGTVNSKIIYFYNQGRLEEGT